MTEGLLERQAHDDDPVVRVLYRVFAHRLPHDERTRETVWPMFADSMEADRDARAMHVRKVAQSLGALAGAGGREPSLQQLADWHANVRKLEDGSTSRMTGDQFDTTLGIIVEELDAEGMKDAVLAVVGPKLEDIRAAIVHGIVPHDNLTVQNTVC
ncbi:MAG TPA: hypothetical protein VF733_03335 [Candidatus Saccharimonadales bacterium]